jgi:single-strand DNA-binding protein
MSADTTSRCNQVQLVGRLAADAVQRELPSGDRLATFRLVIDRPESAVGPRVDTIDCAVWRSDLRRRVVAWGAGDVLRVEGELRRRFWRAGAGVASRYEVEVGAARRLARAP